MNLHRKIIALGLVVIATFLWSIIWSAPFASAEEEAVGDALETTIQDEQQPIVTEMNDQAQTQARTVTITGTINEDYQLVSKQGTVYEIAETEAGDVMVQYVGEEVIAKGTVSTIDDQRVLFVVSFEFVEK